MVAIPVDTAIRYYFCKLHLTLTALIPIVQECSAAHSWIEYSATNRAVEGSNPSECAIWKTRPCGLLIWLADLCQWLSPAISDFVVGAYWSLLKQRAVKATACTVAAECLCILVSCK